MAEVVIGSQFFEETQTEIDYRVREGSRGIEVFDEFFSSSAEDVKELLSNFIPSSAESNLFNNSTSRIMMTVTNVSYFERTDFLRFTINYRAFGQRSFAFDYEEMFEFSDAELVLITYAEKVMSLRVDIPV
jgi:hypothetical protein